MMVNELDKRRLRAAIPPLFALLLSPLLPLPSAAAPTFEDLLGPPAVPAEDQARAKKLEALSGEIEAGVTDLHRHYLAGADRPAPPAAALEFLLFRSRMAESPGLEELALKTAAVYASLRAHDYVWQGIEVAPAVFEKKADEEARTLSLLLEAWRVSRKEMLARAARELGDDLARWSVTPGKSAAGLIQLTLPESLAAPWVEGAPDPDAAEKVRLDERVSQIVFRHGDTAEGAGVAAALLEAGQAFERPVWLAAARTLPMSGASGSALPADVSAASNPARRLESARRLLAVMAAASGRPHATWKEAGRYWAGQLLGLSAEPETPLDPISGGWAALALMRYWIFAHDDSSHALALRLLDGFAPPGSTPKERDPELFGAQAAAAMALQMHLTPPPMAYIVADPGSALTDSLVSAALRADRPGRLVALHAPDEPDLLYPGNSEGKPIVYVCSGDMCAPPVDSPAAVKELLETFALPGATSENPGVGESPE